MRFKLLLKFIFIFSVIGIICFAFFAVSTINSINFDEMNMTSSLNSFRLRDGVTPSVLEEGAVLSNEELNSYALFSDGKIEKEGYFKKIKNNRLLILKEQQLNPMLMNDCKEVYCYQHRIKFEGIPSIFWKGLIGIEDRRFLNHSGVDIKSIIRAIVTDLKEMKLVQGGSTLTQQLVKNLFLSSEKTLERKIKELIVSIYLETKLSKEKILETYFNEVYWGSAQGIRVKGIYGASLFYFGKKINEITAFEAAILISLLKGPGYYSPYRHLNRLKKRVNVVFKKLNELNLFPSGEENRWYEKDWKKWHKSLLERNKKRHYYSLWRVVGSQANLLSDFEQFIFNLKSAQLLRSIKERYPKIDIAMKGIIGHVKKENNYRFYSKTERSKKRAIEEEKHAIGSTIKPIIYQSLMELGLSLDDEVSLDPISLKLKSGVWSPRESHKYKESKTTVLEALQKSMNNPLIRKASDYGFDELEESLQGVVPDLKIPLKEYPAQLLGAVELSLKQMYQMYGQFIDRECSINDKQILMALSDPNLTTIRRQVKKDIGGMRFFGKTGTSNKGFDNWFVWFDGSYLGILWIGVESNRNLDSLSLYGGTTAFRVLQNFYRDRGKRFSELGCHFITQSP